MTGGEFVNCRTLGEAEQLLDRLMNDALEKALITVDVIAERHDALAEEWEAVRECQRQAFAHAREQVMAHLAASGRWPVSTVH